MFTTAHRSRSLTTSQLQEIKAELTREARRFAPDDPRSQVFAAALARVEAGTYGICETCSNTIPHERLSVMPETLYCIGCRRDSS